MKNIKRLVPKVKPHKKRKLRNRLTEAVWFRRFAITVLVICITIIVISVSLVTEEEITLSAYITPVENGYMLKYPILDFTIVTDKEYHVGEKIYVDDNGNIGRNGVPLVISSVNYQDGTVHFECKFGVKNIPDFLSVSEFTEMYNSGNVQSTGRIISKLNLTGKIIGDRFVQTTARFS